MNRRLAALIAAALLVAQSSVRAAAVDALAQVQALYESASYEQALDVLDRLAPGDASTIQDQQVARRYRVLCLVALERNGDAERVLDEMIRADLTSPPLPGELSPRLEALVKQSRQRVAKSIVKETYEQGRELYQREKYAEAAESLGRVVSLIQDPSLGLKADPSLADLGVLADGFHELAKALAASAGRAAPPTSPKANEDQTALTTAATQPSAPEGAPRPDSAIVLAESRLEEPSFVPPKPIAQPIPPLDRAMSGFVSRREGLIEIEVGADGSVVSATVRLPTVVAYDALLVATAKRDWKYEPATRLGVPTPYRLRVKYVVASR